MSCCRHPIPIAAAGLAAALVVLASGAGPVAAQEGGAGRLATFSLSQSLEQTRNRRLVPGGDETALVSTTRAGLGASQNQLESAVNNLNSNIANLSDARSRIEDADYAAESTALAKSQILSQASTAMLAQANQSQQNVLSLLR